MEIIVQPIYDIGKCLWVPLKCRINYVRKFKENFVKLNQEIQNLYARREDVNREIENNRILKVPISECNAWLKKMGEIEIKVSDIEAKFKENKKCLGEWCPNIWWRMKLGKRIMTIIDDIAMLKMESKFEGGIVVVAPPGIVDPLPAPIIKKETSSDNILQKIIGCLSDDKIKMIGVWGMGGVGKTTILKNVNNSPEIIPMFQIIIWVTVSNDWSVKKVQTYIANKLKLMLGDNESDDGVASKLYQKLGTMKYLLLLDDMWDRVDLLQGVGDLLEAVGVPNPTRENGCKIVLTTRNLSVCRQMKTDMDIMVEVLPENEAWDLFHEEVGDVVDFTDIKPLATKLVEECGGLPLVLLVIGRTLRKVNDVHVWSNAPTEFRRATFQIGNNMEELVFMRLKFSFDRLKDANVKNCFLYCALYPDDFEIPIRELIEHWWAEGFIDRNLNFNEAYDKGHAILNDLTNASLLERAEDYCHGQLNIKMHDVIRDMALRITSIKGEGFGRFVVKAGIQITATPNEEEWEQAKRMSLMQNDLTNLRNPPECASITTLLLQNTYNLREISESFFEFMHHSLQVLNLSGTHITKLPSSLLNVATLRGLYLENCTYLHTLPYGVGHLTGLEMLHLGPSINYLPVEVGQLSRLKSLRVRFRNDERSKSPSTHIIPDGLLSRLTLLEDLRMLMDTETVELYFSKYTKSVVEELVSLKQLISLDFHFPKVEYLGHFLQRSPHWSEGRFKSFKFVVGITTFSDDRLADRYLGLKEKEDDDDMSNVEVIREVITRCSGFFLQDNKRCKKLSELYSIEMMNNGLQFCDISGFDAIETLIDGKGLPNLKYVYMRNLPELRSIWEGTVPPQSVTFLKVLIIRNCQKLSNIFLICDIIIFFSFILLNNIYFHHLEWFCQIC